VLLNDFAKLISRQMVSEWNCPLDKKQSCVLIHYMDDHKTTVECPHGNYKSIDKQFVRTCPSVINAAKQSVDLASNVRI